MIYPPLILLLTALLSLIVIGFKHPASLRSRDFTFTRKCLGVAIVFYGASLIFMQSMLFDDDILGFAIFCQIPLWISFVFVFRGIFEVLASVNHETNAGHGAGE